MFSPNTIEALTRAGWHEGRNISEKELKLPYDHYPQKAIDFLTEFGNLEVKSIPIPHMPDPDKFYTYPETSAQTLEEEYKYYGNLLGRKLYPIGTYMPECYYICCDKDCRTYLIGEYCLFYGNDIYQAFDQMLKSDKTDILQLDEDDVKWWNRHSEYVELPPLE